MTKVFIRPITAINMLYSSKQQFIEHIRRSEPRSRVLALDFGLKRVGVAITNPDKTIAFPRGVLKRQSLKSDLKQIKALVQSNAVIAVIMGLPLHLDGRESELSQACRMFGQIMIEQLGIHLYFVDERLSSKLANNMLAMTGIKRRQRSEMDDGAVATMLLERFLEALTG